jgi:pimeloyl-ACP methyl ester carboxylesterase
MTFSIGDCWSGVVRGSFAALLLAVAGLAADPAGAEIIDKEDTLRGITMTREDCEAKPQTLWLNVYDEDFCVRYYLSTAGGEGTRPVVILNGDRNGPIDLKSWNWKDPSKAKDTDTDRLVGTADRFSKKAGTTAIYIARIGVEGSSGSHLSRRTLVEVNLMDMVLDALRQRHGFEGFHLVGQSGGGTLVFGLAEMRRDVGCLISTSGGIVTRVPASLTGDPRKTFFDLMGNVKFLAQNRDLRIIVISDPDDEQVPTATRQTPMVDLLREKGHEVLHFSVEASGPKRHGTLAYGLTAMGGCVRGKSDAEITEAIDAHVSRKAELNQRRQDEARDNSASRTDFATTPR